MKEVLSEIGVWKARGDRIALATVIDVQRSAPRPPGAKMAVNEHGEIAGSVSGGCVEGAVAEIADGILRGDPPQLAHFGIADSDAWDVGLPCGGEIDVWVQAYLTDPATHPATARFEDVARAGGRAAEVTVLEGASPGAKLLVEPDGSRSGSLGAPELDDEATRIATEQLWAETSERHDGLFIDVVAPAPRLLMFGAVDIAASLSGLARAAGWRPYVIDPRARFATADRFPDAEEVIAAWPEEAVAQLGGVDPATSIVVLTHDPKLDDAALLLALSSPARFIGAMGSRRAQAKRRERLVALGLGEDELERVSAPVGLDLGGISREETALSILAEIVAARHGRDGGRLAESRGRIHEVPA
jgi:xanthine dehydrogenase accessory factor